MTVTPIAAVIENRATAVRKNGVTATITPGKRTAVGSRESGHYSPAVIRLNVGEFRECPQSDHTIIIGQPADLEAKVAHVYRLVMWRASEPATCPVGRVKRGQARRYVAMARSSLSFPLVSDPRRPGAARTASV